MDKTTAEKLIKRRFNIFKNKLVDEYPEYRNKFDSIISKEYDNGTLWELLEGAENRLKKIIKSKSGANNLLASDYYKALLNI